MEQYGAALVWAWPAFVIVAIIGLVVALVLLVRSERRMRESWETIAKGEFLRVEYRQRHGTRRSGVMVHQTTTILIDVTVVYFLDGRAYIVNGRINMTFPRGTNIRIEKNGLGSHRLASL